MVNLCQILSDCCDRYYSAASICYSMPGTTTEIQSTPAGSVVFMACLYYSILCHSASTLDLPHLTSSNPKPLRCDSDHFVRIGTCHLPCSRFNDIPSPVRVCRLMKEVVLTTLAAFPNNSTFSASPLFKRSFSFSGDRWVVPWWDTRKACMYTMVVLA